MACSIDWIYIFGPREKLRSLCAGAALMHAVFSVIFLVLLVFQEAHILDVQRLRMPTTKTAGVWVNRSRLVVNYDNESISSVLDLNSCPLATDVTKYDSAYIVQQVVLQGPGDIDSRVLIIIFHFLSAFFQFLAAMDGNMYYENILQGHVNIGHFVEYSLSASIMIVAMCGQLELTDIYLILSITANCWGCMIFGLLAELMFERNINIIYDKNKVDAYWVAHFAGWVLILVMFVGVTSNIDVINRCTPSTSAVKIPQWVLGIVYTELFLFGCFGIVQGVSFYVRGNLSGLSDGKSMKRREQLATYTEASYIILSFTAKTILGWGIIFGNFVNSKNK